MTSFLFLSEAFYFYFLFLAFYDLNSQLIIISYYSFFGGHRLLSIWPQLSSSPILLGYAWSPLIISAIARNFPILQPQDPQMLYTSSPSTLTGLVAVHLRRGDYERHCPRLASWGSTYMGFNLFPSLPDKFDPTPYSDSEEEDNSSLESYYLQHCLPTIPQIVARLHEVREMSPSLKRVFVLTNAWAWWLRSLNKELKKDGWDGLASTLDIQLDSEQHHVGMAVDMAIAERAEIFIGNGVSFTPCW